MNESVTWVLAAAGGVLIGGVYFTGLWWTVRRSLAANASAWLLTVSLVVRVAICLGGFYLVGAGDPARMLACLAGFVIARLLMTRLAGQFSRSLESGSSGA